MIGMTMDFNRTFCDSNLKINVDRRFLTNLKESKFVVGEVFEMILSKVIMSF